MALLILANSYKEGGKCLAGVTKDDELTWIRPVDPTTAHGQVPSSRCFVDDGGRTRSVELLDIVEVPLGVSCSEPHQPENVELAPGALTLVQRADRAGVIGWLVDRARTSGKVLGLSSTASVSVDYAARGLGASLDLVLVEDPVFHHRTTRTGREQLRVSFSLDGCDYDLSVTDPDIESIAPRSGVWKPGGRWLLVVSLTVPWNGRLWLLVAGCIRVDDQD